MSHEESNGSIGGPARPLGAPEDVEDYTDEESVISDVVMGLRDEAISKPPRFYGNRDAVEPFIAHCVCNFGMYPTRFPDMRKEIQYFLNNMGGPAYEWASQMLSRYPAIRTDRNQFIDRLRNTFGDPDLYYNYQRQFRRLRQKSIGQALDYTNEFRRLAVFINTDENLLMDQYYSGLLARVQERLDLIFPPPATLDDLARLTIRLDRQLAERNGDNSRRTTFNHPRKTQRNFQEARPRNHQTTQQSSTNNITRCTYCHRVGHEENNCYTKQADERRRQTPNHIGTITLAQEIEDEVSNRKSKQETRNNCPIIPFELQVEGKNIVTNFLIDSGSFTSFLDKQFINDHKIPFKEDEGITHANGIGGKLPILGKTTQLQLRYKNHTNLSTFYVISLIGYDGILGIDWLTIHEPHIGFRNKQLTFDSAYCRNHCYSGTENLFGISAIGRNEDQEFISIPKELEDLKDVFDERLPEKLPPHRIYDCRIDLKPTAVPFYGPLYSMSQKETNTLQEYLEENVKKGFIKPSTSPYGAPVLFVPKKDGSLRLCVDYRKLNNDTVKNAYPLPLIKDLLDRVRQCTIFTKLDLPGAYNLVRIRDGDQPKTAFRTRFGNFEYEVMPFGLCNAPATFQFFLNDILSEVLDKYAYSYIDDILIFSKTKEEHIKHVRRVLKILLDNCLYCKLKKCEFFKEKVEFLGFVLSKDGIDMCESKIKAIKDWPVPTSVKEVQQFVGLANYYRRFVKDFATIAKPLHSLTKKNTKFVWTDSCQVAFETLKQTFTEAPVLKIPNPERKFYVETDASNFAMGAVLSQKDENEKLHPCAFISKAFKNAELRYTIYDRELLAVVFALKEWRHYLMSAKEPFTIYTDHINLKFPRKPQELSPRQIRWNEFLSKFNYKIIYRKGSENKKADLLSRRPDLIVAAITSSIDHNSIIDSINEYYSKDAEAEEIIKKIKEGNYVDKYHYTNNVLYLNNLIYVPDGLRKKIIQNYHSSPAAGHFGINKTKELIKRNYFWKTMNQDIEDFVKHCDVCARMKNSTHPPYGLVELTETPSRPWAYINVDFLTDLPVSNGYTGTMNVIDQFSKMIHIIPICGLPNAEDVANLFLSYIFKIHGLPYSITSDRGSQFTSKFWKKLLQILNIDCKFSTAHHHQSNGQIERLNGTISQVIRCTTQDEPTLWSYYLPLIEFAINNSTSSTTGKSPFEVVYGYSLTFDPFICFQKARTHAEITTLDWKLHFEEIKKNIEESKNSYKIHADKGRIDGPKFNVGDYVWMNSISTLNKLSKTSPRRSGPYKIVEKLSPVTYKLDLPNNTRKSNIVHVERLEKYL